MKKSWNMIPKILSGEKTIESRWYRTRRAPWNMIKEGDRVYFKNSEENIIAKSIVEKVLQFEIKSIDYVFKIINIYGKKICLVEKNPEKWKSLPKYCILIFLKNSGKLKKPFQINKNGFGMNSAWLSMKRIEKIMVRY